jgi:amidohydrolase
VDPKSAAKASYDGVRSELRSISRWLYENPELGHREFESSARLVELLGSHGFEVAYPAWGLETSFDAVVGDGPEVVICAEYDALPDIGHACGHNIIATAACGAGIALAPLAGELGIRVRVLGTPAEEAFGGKVDLIEAGAFADTVAAMMVHPSTTNDVDAGFLAVKHFDVEFHGKETHAGSSPQLGVNALDAAVQAYVNVSTLRQTLLPTDRVHGIITDGGQAPNITPDFTSMAWYVRAIDLDRLGELVPKVDACFAAAALATGCTHEIREHGHLYRDMKVNRLMADLYAANSETLGRPVSWVGDASPKGGSTDMGNVSHVVPAIHPMLDIGSKPAVNHQRDFAAHTVTPQGDRAIDDGALAMAWTIIDLAVEDRWAELASA